MQRPSAPMHTSPWKFAAALAAGSSSCMCMALLSVPRTVHTAHMRELCNTTQQAPPGCAASQEHIAQEPCSWQFLLLHYALKSCMCVCGCCCHGRLRAKFGGSLHQRATTHFRNAASCCKAVRMRPITSNQLLFSSCTCICIVQCSACACQPTSCTTPHHRTAAAAQVEKPHPCCCRLAGRVIAAV